MEKLHFRGIGIALVCGIGLTACGGEGQPASPEPNDEIQHSVEVADGRYYDCMVYTAVNRGGIDCEPLEESEAGNLPQPNHNEEIAISVVRVEGRVYDCFAYTTVKRGGLSCTPV